MAGANKYARTYAQSYYQPSGYTYFISFHDSSASFKKLLSLSAFNVSTYSFAWYFSGKFSCVSSALYFS
jgi:hypothetical protein